jgi:tagaturonate epimerase
MTAAGKGIAITPVWNKSNREHVTIGTEPEDVRKEADAAVKNAGFEGAYFVDADHINSDTVDRFIGSSDFFTIDVASYIGKMADAAEIESFVGNSEKYTGHYIIPGLNQPFNISGAQIRQIAEKYLFAAQKASAIYTKIESRLGKGNFITEVSMDEVPDPQTPVELFFILKMLSSCKIPLQTIAPKFSGRFNKGVDYAGDVAKFAGEFEEDLLVIDHAVKEFGLPKNLKISVHSGSDKFAIYPCIGNLIKKHNKGIHIKTAGTTWLEELIGLAESGGKGLQFAREVYSESLDKIEELCTPYADVIDIRSSHLPTKDSVNSWNSKQFAGALRHIPGNTDYNSDMRQLIHVAYKIAAHRMDEFYTLLDLNKDIVSECVYENIYTRHICRLFGIS